MVAEDSNGIFGLSIHIFDPEATNGSRFSFMCYFWSVIKSEEFDFSEIKKKIPPFYSIVRFYQIG